MITTEGEGHINRYLRLDIHSWRTYAIMCFICFQKRNGIRPISRLHLFLMCSFFSYFLDYDFRFLTIVYISIPQFLDTSSQCPLHIQLL